MVLELLASLIRQKNRKDILKITYYITVYIENSKESTEKLLELAGAFVYQGFQM